MTSKTNLNTLASRVEDASGPDRELDLEIGLQVLGWQWVDNEFDSNPILDFGAPNHVGWKRGNPLPDCIPSPTGSLDEAVKLVPHDLFFDLTNGYLNTWTGSRPSEEWSAAHIYRRRTMDSPLCVGQSSKGATPALALCAASLRAQSAMEGTK